MKVKNDHRGKFSSLREEPEKHQGFNGIRTRDLRDTGAMVDQHFYFPWITVSPLTRAWGTYICLFNKSDKTHVVEWVLTSHCTKSLMQCLFSDISCYPPPISVDKM